MDNIILPRVTARRPSTSSGVMALPDARSSSSVTGRRSAATRLDLSLFTTPPPPPPPVLVLRSLAAAADESLALTVAVLSVLEL